MRGFGRVSATVALCACGGDAPVIDAPIDASDDVIDAPVDALTASCQPRGGTTIVLEPVVDTLDLPVMIASPPNDPRLFVIEQDGAIRIIDDGVLLPTPFLDLRGASGPLISGGERGLLGIAFHPDFATTNKLYVHISAKPDGDHLIAEFQAIAGTDTADVATRRDVLRFDDPFTNNNGGSLEFGLDGMLYIAIGDGGSNDDPLERAQSDTSLHGKILRIDVDSRTGAKQYGIPADNPFASSPDGPGDPRPEIWHRGLRNPFRFTFDRATGDIYIGDVGQGPTPPNIEEIDVAANAPGINWGWDVLEGDRCHEPSIGCSTDGMTAPAIVRGLAAGWTSVIGGQVYRGTCFPDLAGTYFYGEYTTGEVWAFEWDGDAAVNDRRVVSTSVGNVTSIHEDAVGELYLTTYDGGVFRITAE